MQRRRNGRKSKYKFPEEKVKLKIIKIQKYMKMYEKNKSERLKKKIDDEFSQIYYDIYNLCSVIITTRVLSGKRFQYGSTGKIEGESSIVEDLILHSIQNVYIYIPKIDTSRKIYSIISQIQYQSSLVHFYKFYQNKLSITNVQAFDEDLDEDYDSNESYYINNKINNKQKEIYLNSDNIIMENIDKFDDIDLLDYDNEEKIKSMIIEIEKEQKQKDINIFFNKLHQEIIREFGNNIQKLKKMLFINSIIYLFYKNNYNGISYFFNKIFKKKLKKIKNSIEIIQLQRMYNFVIDEFLQIVDVTKSEEVKDNIFKSDIEEYQKIVFKISDNV